MMLHKVGNLSLPFNIFFPRNGFRQVEITSIIAKLVLPRSRTVWPDWAIFRSSWQISFLQKQPKYCMTFGLFGKASILQKKLLWLLFGQLFEEIGLLFPPYGNTGLKQGAQRMWTTVLWVLFLKMGQPRPLFHSFSVFSNKQYNFYNKSM